LLFPRKNLGQEPKVPSPPLDLRSKSDRPVPKWNAFAQLLAAIARLPQQLNTTSANGRIRSCSIFWDNQRVPLTLFLASRNLAFFINSDL
jgi:hypothetical protein